MMPGWPSLAVVLTNRKNYSPKGVHDNILFALYHDYTVGRLIITGEQLILLKYLIPKIKR